MEFGTNGREIQEEIGCLEKQYLSKEGRLILVKCTLSNLPIYFMSLFVIPRKVRIGLERVQREFLRGDMEERRKIHLVSWLAICKDKKYGGLGLRHLEGLNQALLGKWLWIFSLERKSFWRRVISGNFGKVEGAWTTREVRDSFRLSLWKDIRNGWEEFILRTSICIGNRRHTSFWWDNWVEDAKLEDFFPSLFRIAAHKYATMANL